MIPVPTDARRELYGLQCICAAFDHLDYVDIIWKRRTESDTRTTKSIGSWPYKRAADQPSNVTRLPKRGEKK